MANGDPLKELHHRMVASDLLTGPNREYEAFAASLATPENRQKLYEVLKSDGKVSVPFQDFEAGYFANYEPPVKKKDGGAESGTPSVDASAPAQDAGIPSEINPILYPPSAHPLNKPEYGGLGAVAQKDTEIDVPRRDEAMPGMNEMRSESTSAQVPLKGLPEMNITGRERPSEYGDQYYRQQDQGYDYKERRAAKSDWRKGTRDMSKVEVYANDAKKQSDFAAFGLKEKFGPGWLDEVQRLEEELGAPAASVSPDEIMEKQARLNNIKNDPLFTKWADGVQGQQNAFEEYRAIAKQNPGYVKAVAQQEFAQKTADDSKAFKAASFIADITGPVVAGIATLPRTLLSAVGVQDVPIIEDIADWGDKQTEFVQTQTSTGSRSDRQLWEQIVPFDGMEVQVDNNGRPVSAYKNGKKAEMTPEQIKAFTETDTGKKARTTFTGWENAGWSTAKQLANLYLMRSLGGGTAIGTGATSFTISYNDLYNEAIEQLGYSPTDASQYAIANAGVQAAAEAYLGKIDVAPMKLNLARTMGVNEAKAVAGTISAKEVGKAAGKAMMKEVLGENAEELVQTASDHLVTAMFNAKTGGNIERQFDAQQLAETILMTTATTLLAGGADTPRAARNEMRVNALLAATQNPSSVQPVVQELVAAGKMTQDEATKVEQRVAALAQVEEALPAEMKPEDKAYVLALELEKMQKQEKVTKESPKPVADTVKAEVAEIEKVIEAVKEPSSVPEGEPSPIVEAEIEAPTSIAKTEEEAFTELPQATVVGQEQAEATVAETQEITPQDAVSDDVRPHLDQADVENLNAFVQDNISDPEILAEYPSRQEAVVALTKEYEDNILRNKHAAAIARGVPAQQDNDPETVNLAHDAAMRMDDKTASETEAYLDSRTKPNGEPDVQAIENDIAAGVPVPEAVKQIINEQELEGGPEQGQRGEETQRPVEGTPETAQRQPNDEYATEAVGDDGAEGTADEPAPQRQESIKKRLKKAPLPVIDGEVLAELVNDGHIGQDVADAAERYMNGDITADTANAYNAALDARDGLRKVIPRKTMVETDEIQVYQRQSDGVLEVSGEAAASYGVKWFGGKWNAKAQKWIIPAESAPDALAHIVEQMSPVVEQNTGGALGGGMKEVMSQPGAVINAKRRRARYKGASSFAERLRIAAAEHGIRKDVSDPKRLRKVLDRLKATMPGVKVVTDAKEFSDKVKEIGSAKGVKVEVRDGIPGFLLEDGRWEAPVAFEADGVVYLNERLAHIDALVHEFGHLWNSWLRVNDPQELARGVEAVRDTDYHEAVKNHPLYADLSEEQQLEEALAQAIGDAGRRITEMTPFIRFRNWIGEMWRAVERSFGIQRAAEYTLKQWADNQAATLLSGSEATRQSGTRIVSDEQRAIAKQRAQAMERAGENPEQIYAATGYRRIADGDWKFSTVQATPMYDEHTRFKAGQTLPLSEVVSVPAFTAYPGHSQSVRIEAGVVSPRLEGETIVMSPVMDAAYIQKAVALAQQNLPLPVLDSKPVENNQYTPRFLALSNSKPKVALVAKGSADHTARMQSAKQIVRIELQNAGMKDYEAKAKELADTLGLRLDDVLQVWQQEAAEAKHGRFVLALGDAKSLGLGKMGELAEAANIKKEIFQSAITEWFRRYFTVSGLLPSAVKHLADRRGEQIAGRMREARFLLNDLNAAMKKAYGKPTDGHWRLVDNVLRGDAGWDVLPVEVQAAAVNVRNFTDAMSQELITSGATNGKMIVTILNNSGVAATQEMLEDWNGFNLYEALDKLPYLRTDEEQAAIKEFLRQNNKMLGSYFYRSYRKHKDKNWAKKVPPAVLNDAREFLRSEIEKRIEMLEEAQNTKVEDVQKKIDAAKAAIAATEQGIRDALAGAEQAFKDATDAVAHSTHPDPALLQAQADAKAEMEKWLDAQKDADAVLAADIQIMFDLTAADMNAYSDQVWAMIEARKIAYNLQELQDAAVDFKQSELDNLVRILNTPYGAKQGGIDGIIANILEQEDTPEGVMVNAKLGSKDLSFLKKRKDIPVEIRDLMGEYHDARLNFASSVMRMANTIEDQNFLAHLRQEYEGVYFWPPEMEDMGPQLAPSGSASMDPLNGWRTTPEIKKGLEDYFNPRTRMPGWVSALRYFSDMVKYGKTIVSPVTHARNFFSNIYFAIQNGYGAKHLRAGSIAFTNAWTNTTDEAKRAYIEKMVRLGIVGEGAWSADMRELMGRLSSDAIDQMVVSGNMWTSANQVIQRTYQAEDDFWRIIGFETEKNRYAKATFKKPFETLTTEQQAEIEEKAASIVAETIPTYSKVPRFASALREIPLFGTFIAFPAEMFRVTANQVKRVQKDMRDPRTRGIALTRLRGMALAQSLPMTAVALFRHIVGVGDEEEDAARFFVPEWQKDSPWVWETFKPGESFSFRNLGYSDPYAFYKRPIVSMLTDNGSNMTERLGDAAWGLVKPFLDVELTTGTILALAYNKKPGSEDPIYNPGAGILGDWQATAKFATKQLQPGVVKFGFDVAEALTGESETDRPPKGWDDIVLNMVGYQTEATNVDKAVRQRIYASRKAMEWSRELFTRNQFKAKTASDLDALYERATYQYNNALKDLSLCIKNAEIIGVPPGVVNDMVSGPRRGFSNEELMVARAMVANPNARLYPSFKGYNK